MSQPTPYARQANFTDHSADYPSQQQPGQSLDAEFDAAKTTLDQILANLRLIQRDDGRLANLSVGTDQLAAGLTIGINPLYAIWSSGTHYSALDGVWTAAGVFYRCLIAHTSTVFSTDLAAGKWIVLFTIDPVVMNAIAAAQASAQSASDAAVTSASLASSYVASVAALAATLPPVPTVPDADKSPVVNESGVYALRYTFGPNLSAITTPAGTETIAVHDGANLKRVTITQIVNLATSNTTLARAVRQARYAAGVLLS